MSDSQDEPNRTCEPGNPAWPLRIPSVPFDSAMPGFAAIIRGTNSDEVALFALRVVLTMYAAVQYAVMQGRDDFQPDALLKPEFLKRWMN